MLKYLITALLASLVYNQETEASNQIQEPKPVQKTVAPWDEESHYEAFVQSFSAIFVSEIGDRTFFVAAIMAMRYNKFVVFLGSGGALVFMTLISCMFGAILPQLIPKMYTQIVAMVLFFVFGVKLIWEWRYGDDDGVDEKQEVEVELQNLHKKLVSSVSGGGHDIEQQQQMSPSQPQKKASTVQIPPQMIAWQAFTITFLNEWGDRSQISTIALAAVHHGWLVFLGGSLGHILCTIIAIAGGDMVSERISQKTINLIGGLVFLLFGLFQGYMILSEY